MTSGTLVIWLLSRLDNGIRRPCPDGFDWSAGSSMNCQWYGTLEESDYNTRWYWLLLLYKYMTCLIHVYYLLLFLAWYMFTTCYCSLPDTCFLLYSCISYCTCSFIWDHVICLVVTLPDTCYTFCSGILFVHMCIYYIFYIPCIHHHCLCTTPYTG